MDNKLLSPTLPPPVSPAPAYSTLPFSDIEYDFAPMLNGRHGELEFETSDGKRFLVHKKVLEQETIFFHIYYGFVPNWRVNQQRQQQQPSIASAASALNTLLCLPKLFQRETPREGQPPPVPPKSPVPAYDESPPSPITAPMPTDTPLHWLVPEASGVLHAFLSLIYPLGAFTSSPVSPITCPKMAGLVLRAALGYQSVKAVSLARDALGSFAVSHPLETFAYGSYFRFNDTARIASRECMRIAPVDWPESAKQLMGRRGRAKLQELREERLQGLNVILDRPVFTEVHCNRSSMLQDVWSQQVAQVKEKMLPSSDLSEMCSIDVRGGHCGDCLHRMGQHLQECLQDAKKLREAV